MEKPTNVSATQELAEMLESPPAKVPAEPKIVFESEKDDVGIDYRVTIPAVVIVLSVVLWGLLNPTSFSDFSQKALSVVITNFGWAFVLCTTIFLAFAIIVALSKFGNIKLGRNDEAPEFGARILDALRTPLESGWVTIGRAAVQVRYPARFQLVLAANPCPCGFHGVVGRECRCSPMMVRRYQERLSGPIMDRIDIRHHMLPQHRSFLGDAEDQPESSADIAARVLQARDRQLRRLSGTPWRTNGEVAGPWLRSQLPLPRDVSPLERALNRGLISTRGVDKVLRLAWTITDLAEEDQISASSLRVAMQLRQGTLQEAA